ncbi:MAG: hypothetical protein GXP45_00655 [bacterium]|nr:hypothetical protein [bacterium]
MAKQFELARIIQDNTFHDALIDSKNTILLFQYMVTQINILIQKYPRLQLLLNQSQSILPAILNIDSKKITRNQDPIPHMEKLLPKDTKLYTHKDFSIHNYPSLQRYYIGNVAIKELLTKLSQSPQQILAFSSRQKLDIAKTYFQEMGLKNIGFAREDQGINYTIFKSFLNKGDFNENEIFFILKYYSQSKENNSFLDLNSKKDYEIYYFLKEPKKAHKYPLVLTTHGGLFSLLDKKDSPYHSYDISFFDSEQRYNSYNNYLSRPCDLYQTLNFIETLLYTYHTRNQIKTNKYKESIQNLESFYQFFQIFMGTIFAETTQLFTKTIATWIEYHPIINNAKFYKTTTLRSQHTNHMEKLKKHLLADDIKKLEQQINHIDEVLNGLVNINKKLHNPKGEFYFIFKKTNQFTNRDEFTEIFASRHILFLSHSNNEYPKLTEDKETFEHKYELITIHHSDYVIKKVKELLSEDQHHQIFILSSKKPESKYIFEQCIKEHLDQKAQLIAENIT